MPTYDLIEYSSNYSGTTESLWFYSKEEATDFNADITNDNGFKSFMYKAKSLGITEAGGNSGILKIATIAVPLKYLSNLLRSLEMSSINYKISLKLKVTCFGCSWCR